MSTGLSVIGPAGCRAMVLARHDGQVVAAGNEPWPASTPLLRLRQI